MNTKNGEGLFAALGVDSAAFCADLESIIVIADYDYDNGMLVSVQCAELDANSIYRTNLTEKRKMLRGKCLFVITAMRLFHFVSLSFMNHL